MAGILRSRVDRSRARREDRARHRGRAQAARHAREPGQGRGRAVRGRSGEFQEVLPRRYREVAEPGEEHPSEARVRNPVKRLFVSLAVCAAAGSALAQDYPTRPIKFITAAAQGGTSDILARTFAVYLTEDFKQPVVVDNRASASGVIAGELTANAAPDGYTIMLVYHQHTVNAALNPNLPYHPVNSFTPITQLTSAGLMLVVNDSAPPKNLAGELYNVMTGVKAEHIPYKGTGPALVDLMAGRYQYNFAGLLGAQVQVRAGKLRAIAVTTPKRIASLPDLPAVAEALPGFEVVGWYGVMGPAGLPAPIVTKLHDEFVKVLKRPDVHERIVADGSEPVGSGSEEFRQFMLADLAKWAKLVKESGAKLN